MDPIRVGAAALSMPGATPSGRTAGRFRLAPAKAAAAGPPRTDAVGALATVGAGLLGLQELGGAADRDAGASRRADALLDELARLQRGLFDQRESQTALTRLAALGTGEDGADPALRGILRAIATRAAVELARRERSGSASVG